MKANLFKWAFLLFVSLFFMVGVVSAFDVYYQEPTISEVGNGGVEYVIIEGGCASGVTCLNFSTIDNGDYVGVGFSIGDLTVNDVVNVSLAFKQVVYVNYSGIRLGMTLLNGSDNFLAVTSCANASTDWTIADFVDGTGIITSGASDEVWWYGTWDGENQTSYNQSIGSPITLSVLKSVLGGATIVSIAPYQGMVTAGYVGAGEVLVDNILLNGDFYSGNVQDAVGFGGGSNVFVSDEEHIVVSYGEAPIQINCGSECVAEGGISIFGVGSSSIINCNNSFEFCVSLEGSSINISNLIFKNGNISFSTSTPTNNVLLENLVVSNFSTAFRSIGSNNSNLLISNSTFNNLSSTAITIGTGGDPVSLGNLTVSNNYLGGTIYLAGDTSTCNYYFSNVVFENNSVESPSIAFQTNCVEDVSVFNNDFDGEASSLIQRTRGMNFSNNRVVDYTISAETWTGVLYFNNIDNSVFENNFVNGSEAFTFGVGDNNNVIQFAGDSDNVVLRNNSFYGYDENTTFSFGWGSTVSNYTFINNTIDLIVTGMNSQVDRDMNFYNNSFGKPFYNDATSNFFEDNDFSDLLVEGGVDSFYVGNVFRGLVNDTVVGTSFCDFNDFSDNYFIGGSYAGLNVGSCPEYFEFNVSSDFSSVSNWSGVDLFLGNSFGLINWSGLVDLSGLEVVDFDGFVEISNHSIFVDSASFSELNESAGLVFEGVVADGLEFIQVLRDGVSCGVVCSGESYDSVSDSFSVDVTRFSNYSLNISEPSEGYSPTYEAGDLSLITADVVGTAGATGVIYIKIIVIVLITISLVVIGRSAIKKYRKNN